MDCLSVFYGIITAHSKPLSPERRNHNFFKNEKIRFFFLIVLSRERLAYNSYCKYLRKLRVFWEI